MIVETRNTAAGTEYWDNKAKKVLFVPKGKEPNFEVTVDPKSMVGDDEGLNLKVTIPDETYPSLDEMNAEQLLAFAKENNIDVPGNMSKEETIRKHIIEALNAADE